MHEEILHQLGSSWDDLAPIPDGWVQSGLGQDYVAKMVAIVQEEFQESPLFVVKDPRVCRLVPFWLAVLGQLNADPLFVLPVRNPLEMAESLRKAESVDQQKALLIWLNSILTAEYACRGFPRSIVEYAQLLVDWRSALDKVSVDLGVSFTRMSRKAAAEIDAFLSSELRHEVVSPGELSVRSDVIDWVKLTFDWMRNAAAGKRVAVGKIDALRVAFAEAERVFGPVLAQAEFAREVADSAATELQEKVVELTESNDRLAGQIEPLGGEADALRLRVESREQQVGELINCIKLMLVWIASRAAGNKSSSDELQVLLEALDTSDSESIAEAALEGLRHYQTVLDAPGDRRRTQNALSWTGPMAEAQRVEGPASPSTDSELEDKVQRLEKQVGSREDELRVVQGQLDERQGILQQSLAELAEAEGRLDEQGADFARLSGDLDLATRREEQLAKDLEASRSEVLKASKDLQASQIQADGLLKEVQTFDQLVHQLRESEKRLTQQLQGARDWQSRAEEFEAISEQAQSNLSEIQEKSEHQVTEISALKSVISSHESQIRQQDESLAGERERAVQAQSDLASMQIRARQDESERLALRQRVSESDRELRMMQRSRSWRMMLPLRQLGRLARKMRLTRLLRPFARIMGLGK
ncbi:MAG: hypothetical protein CBC48_16135 [bacterium TMED88]|nr:hypothetical protein [Deltaproteobacteria bacterium]OUV25698.1 MAG: hypothetical protein CBC48_16135 [bacterium TMED88]